MYNLNEIIEELMKKEEIKTEDIPSIDLYMDQVLAIFDKYFPYNENEQELTKTMINNYAKGGIIKPAVKKKYNKEHILTIIIVCILKRNISLSEIKYAFDDFDDVEDTYKKFLDKKDIMNKITFEHLDGILSKLRDDDILTEDNKMLDVLTLCYYSNILSEAARMIIRNKNI